MTRHDEQLRSSPANIILIGYRACGKSTVGLRVATRLGLTFVDMDQVLIQRFGPIRQLVAQHGWPFFRARERELLLELTAQTGQIIATGGGAILQQEIWPRLRQHNLIIWLSATPATIRHRLAKDRLTVEQRPALTDTDVYQEVAEVLTQRRPLYAAGSDLELATDHLNADALAAQIVTAYNQAQRRSPSQTS